MKLAVIDQVGNAGGSSRVVRALLPAFKTLRPDIEITYWGNSLSIKRETLEDELLRAGIEVRRLSSVKLGSEGLFGIKGTNVILRTLQGRYGSRVSFLPAVISGAVHKEVEKAAKGFDLAFFPWPYMIDCPRLHCPVVGIFHDFNFRYYFAGAHTFSPWQLDMLNREIPIWLKCATPVVSSYFMARELGRFYPECSQRVRVVHLASMSTVTEVEKREAQRIVRSLGVNTEYVLYPTNPCSHKNIGPLLAAVPILKRMGHKVALVLTGPGIEMINGRACDIGVELGNSDQDVYGLGYVTNLEMDSLIECASVVVSTSLYEAGNGPGLDAWARGVPVAMSDIPAFREHIDVLGVRAEIFDPRDPQDIAYKIHAILSKPEEARGDAEHSRQALQKIGWSQTAQKYLSIFDEAIEGA